MEFDNLDQVQVEAARALAQITRYAIWQDPHKLSYRKAVAVRDDNGPVLEARVTYEIERRKAASTSLVRPP
jgi:hypothetical protein